MTERRTCPHCLSPLKRHQRPYAYKGVYFGRFDFLVCPVCERTFHPKDTSLAIEAIAQEKGLWGISVEAPEMVVLRWRPALESSLVSLHPEVDSVTQPPLRIQTESEHDVPSQEPERLKQSSGVPHHASTQATVEAAA